MALALTKNIELLERIGLGGAGEVWKAELRVSPKAAPTVIAVKRIFGRATPEECERLFSEARVLEKMNHANVARFLFTGFSDSLEPFLAMEFVEGATLDEHMKQFPLSRLPLDIAANFARQIAAAIDYVASHAEESEGFRNYLVHGDLKPRNLLITPAGQVKVIDFGSARRVNPEVTNTLTGVEFTPRYAPPEVDGGTGSKITEIFSLGAIYFEMLTGKKAIDGETLLKRLEARDKFYLRRNVAQREKCLLESGVDPETVALVQGLLSKKTRERERCFRLLTRQRAADTVRESFGYGEAVIAAPRASSKRFYWLGGLTAAAAAAAVAVLLAPLPAVPAAAPEVAVTQAPVIQASETPAPVEEPVPVLLSFPPLVIEVAAKEEPAPGVERAPELEPAPKKAAPAERVASLTLATSLPGEVKHVTRERPHRYELPPQPKFVAEAAAPAEAEPEDEELTVRLIPVTPDPAPVPAPRALVTALPVVRAAPLAPVVPVPQPRLAAPAPRKPSGEVVNLLPPPKAYADDVASFN